MAVSVLDLDRLNELVADGWVSVKKHPVYDLFVYNYTPKTQYAGFWNPVTTQARGLILNSTGECVARPFPKFFNLEELREVPTGDYTVYNKLDGSLGILYRHADGMSIATRGSFVSEMAEKASEILNTRYAEKLKYLDVEITYLFEIIYPENQVVVDYSGLEDIILIGMVNTKTGEEYDIKKQTIFSTPEVFSSELSLKDLKQLNTPNKEGFVIKWSDNQRCKIKFEDYLFLHKIKTRFTIHDVWEARYLNIPEMVFVADLPDELYDWVRDCLKILDGKYQEILSTCKENFWVLEDRKTTAKYFLSCPYSSILFLMLDGKDYTKQIWRLVEPKNTPASLEDLNYSTYRFFNSSKK